MALRCYTPSTIRVESSRKRRPSLKAKLNVQNTSIAHKKLVKNTRSEPSSPAPSDKSSDNEFTSQVVDPPHVLTPPPKAPDTPYFMMGRIMMGSECIYRDTVETKVYLFSANNFLAHADNALALWEAQTEAKADRVSSVAKITFKNCKQSDIEELSVDSHDSFVSGVDNLIKYHHECGRKVLRCDWTIQYKQSSASIRQQTVSISSGSEDTEYLQSKRRKHRKVIYN